LGTIGTHCVLELYDCPETLLDDVEFVKQALIDTSEQSLSTLLKQVTHRFHPHGVTALGLLAESHISIHTWPEHRYAAADLFTCGDQADPEQACQFLVHTFQAEQYDFIQLSRGSRPLANPLLGTQKRALFSGVRSLRVRAPHQNSVLPSMSQSV